MTAAFTAGGVLMIMSGELLGWFVAVVFGLCVLVFTVSLLPGANCLRVGPNGFTIRSLFRSHSYRWSDVRGFGVGRVGVKWMVVFDFTDEFQGTPRLRKISVALAGHEGALPDSYGMPLEALAELLNEYRDQGTNSQAAKADGSDRQ